jgi:replicative DNA helicase
MSRTLDTHAEHSVLASLMLWPEAFDRVADVLQARDFANAKHQAIFTAIASLMLACKAVDVVTVHAKLQADGVDLPLTDLNAIAQSESTPRAVRRYAEIVKAASLERDLLDAVDRAGGIAEGEGELPQRLEQVVALFGGMAQQTVRRLPRPIDQEIIVNRIDHYTACRSGHAEGLEHAIPGLDDHLMGGLRPGKVYVIAARPKVGKTSLALQIALHCAEERPARR